MYLNSLDKNLKLWESFQTVAAEGVPMNRGDVLLTEEPFVYILGSKFIDQRCDMCLKRGNLLKCTGCNFSRFCNRDCQKLAWPVHKFECSNLKRIQPRIIPDSARFLARLIMKLKKDGHLQRGYYTRKQYRIFKDLMSHYNEVKNDKMRQEHLMVLYGVLTEFMSPELVPNIAELMAIYGRMCVNSFNILDPEMQSIGTAIYLGASIIDHSCDPNAVATFSGTRITIRATKDMPKFKWSDVFISYIDLLNFVKDRQEELEASYYFLCECSRCKDIEEQTSAHLLSCPNLVCQQGIPVNTEHLEDNLECCPYCNVNVEKDMYKQYIEVATFVKEQLKNMKNFTYLDVCKLCLQKQEKLFHPLSLLYVKTLDMAFESSIDMCRWDDAKRFGEQFIPGLRKYCGDLHPLLGVLLFKLGKIHDYLNCSNEALKYLTEAVDILRITHGEEHELYKKELIPFLEQITADLTN